MDEVIETLGGVTAAARLLGISHSAVSNWRRAGRIPDAQKWRLLVLARERGLDITPEQLGLPPARDIAA